MTYPPEPDQGQNFGVSGGGELDPLDESPDFPPVGPGYGYPPVEPYGPQNLFPVAGGYPQAGSYPQAGQYPQAYPSYYGYPPLPATNGMAIAALVTSLTGLFVCFLPSILGLVFGLVALGQIKTSGEQGRGMAIAGIVIGGIVAAGTLAVFGAVMVAEISS